MRFVASWSMEPYLKNVSGRWESTDMLLTAMVMCIDNIKKFYGRNLILYTDSMTEHVLSELTDNVDIVNVYDDIFKKDNIPLSFWCYPKLLTFRAQTEPYVHIDLDFIIKRKFPDGWFDCDIFCQWYEDLTYMDRSSDGICSDKLYNRERVKHLYEWSDWWDDPRHNNMYALNVGIMSIRNVDFNKLYCDTMFDFIDNNKDAMNQHDGTDMQIVPMVIEQQSLYHLAVQEKQSIKTITRFFHDIPAPVNRYFTHFIGDWMKCTDFSKGVEQREYLLKPKMTQKINEMARYVDSERLV